LDLTSRALHTTQQLNADGCSADRESNSSMTSAWQAAVPYFDSAARELAWQAALVALAELAHAASRPSPVETNGHGMQHMIISAPYAG
jgi:hypothetical protein